VWLVLSLVSRHFKGCVNVDSIVRKYCSLVRDDIRFGVAQFTCETLYYCAILLTKTLVVVQHCRETNLTVL